MRENQINRIVLQYMKKIFYSKDTPYIDWMGYKITDENKPSYHHIDKSAYLKGKNMNCEATIDNGAYLGKISHELLHHIELVDYDLYDKWNEIFKVINESKNYPTKDMWNVVYELKEKTEEILYKENNNLVKKVKKQP